ncbi:MAG: FAD-dependent oxidoreductase [Clostridia bacterium]|nr:FAD-dependent oxidoreductase [Clostridia bacterium]
MRIQEPERQLHVTGTYDVTVCGAGIAGIAAALSAARCGSRVLLVEQSQLPGGLAIPGLVVYYLPLCDGMGNQVSFGLAEELLRISIRHGADGPLPSAFLDQLSSEERKRTRFEVQFNPWLFAIDAEAQLLKEGIRILYDTKVCGVKKSTDRITHLILENIDGRTAVGTGAVVDATGSAFIAHLAGEPCAVYAHGNVLSSWYYFLSDGKNHMRTFGEKRWMGEVDEEELLEQIRIPGTDAQENSDVLVLSRQVMLRDFLALREKPGREDAVLTMIPAMQDLRMTRRIEGRDKMVIASDHMRIDSSIGCIGNWRRKGPAYEVPYGALRTRNLENLWAAGRCISTDDDMWDIARVIPPCAVTGEAAGIGAALCAAHRNAEAADVQAVLSDRKIPIHL